MTLTIEAENAAASDVNYAVLRFSVAAKVREKDKENSILNVKEEMLDGLCLTSEVLQLLIFFKIKTVFPIY